MLTHRICSATRKDDIGASLCQIGRERNSQELRIRTARDSQALISSPALRPCRSFRITSSVFPRHLLRPSDLCPNALVGRIGRPVGYIIGLVGGPPIPAIPRFMPVARTNARHTSTPFHHLWHRRLQVGRWRTWWLLWLLSCHRCNLCLSQRHQVMLAVILVVLVVLINLHLCLER